MPSFRNSRLQDNRTKGRRQARREQPFLEDLEGRQLLSKFTVTSTNDSGAGSLRQAIISSNASTGSATNTIDFQIGSSGTKTISLQSALPVVFHPVVIDGTTQPGTRTTPRIVLNGSCAGKATVGLYITASNSTVKGIAIDYFGSDGVVLNSGSTDQITDDYIGVTPAGNKAANGGNGVTISGGAAHNTVGGTAAGAGNLISDNRAHGVEVSCASNNAVQGNLIGTNSTGTAVLGNTDSGIFLENGADDNLIGGTTTGARNVLSGNDLRGLHITSESSGNLVEGNLIGTNAAGTAAVPNKDSGVLIDGCSNNNTIGGATAGAANTISGNLECGVHISGCSSKNLVEGNLIGTSAGANEPLPNAIDGVLIDDGSSSNTVGGTVRGAGNTISSNGNCGVGLDNAGHGNLIEADLIDSNGSSALSAGRGNGVSIVNTAYTSVIGCTIDSNSDWGILVDSGSHTVLTGNTLLNNGLGAIDIT